MIDYELTPEQKHIAQQLLNECTDEQLATMFEEVFEVLTKRLMQIRRKKMTVYSNKRHPVHEEE